MEFNYGDMLRIKNDLYTILGKIIYEDDYGDAWFEYKLLKHDGEDEYWLSWDEIRNEYQFTKPCGRMSTDGMKLVDSGRERVRGVWGDVDVDTSDSADYEEYETESGASTFSIEVWDDETEYSQGFYISKDYVTLDTDTEFSEVIQKRMKKQRYKKWLYPAFWMVVIFIAYAPDLDIHMWHNVRAFFNHPYTASEYIKDNPSRYTYVTSITGTNNLKSDIYQSSLTIDETTQDIIKGLDGEVERVTQDGNTAFTEITDDNISVASKYQSEQQGTQTIPTETVTLLTKYEYITVYISTDKTVLVRIESREAAYNHNNDGGYRSSARSYWFYRNSYWYNGYGQDETKYKSSSTYTDYDPTKNPYKSDYSTGHGAGTSDAARLSKANNYSYSPYESYATSIRNGSFGSRGGYSGGTSSGK